MFRNQVRYKDDIINSLLQQLSKRDYIDVLRNYEKLSSNSNLVILESVSNNTNGLNNTKITENTYDVSNIKIVDSPHKDNLSISEQLRNI